MSNSNPQLKEYIREHLKNMYLEIQESSAARRAETKAKAKALGVPQRPSSPGANAAFARTRNELGLAKETITQQAATNTQLAGNLAVRKGSERGARRALAQAAANNTALAGENATLTSAAAATPMAKWTAGVKGVDSKLFGNAAQGEVAATKGLMGSAGKIGMGTKLAGAGIAAATQGLSSASTEWEENKNKGMGTGFENVAKTAVRGGVAAAGAGAGAYAGMAAGAAFGSAVGPVGTLIGAAVGGIAGGWGGGALADKAADMVTNIGDDDKSIKDFQGNRDIEDIERKARTQAAKQKAEDATRVKAALPGVDYNSNNEDQVQNFTYSSNPNQGNGPGAAGGQMFVKMNQGQRNNPR
jgi:hypothetical protein